MSTGLLRFITAGSVDDGKSTLIGRLLFDSKGLLADQLSAVEAASRRRGFSELDLSLLTGETVPAPVAPGARVFAGTVNRGSPIAVRVERAGEETRVGRLMSSKRMATSFFPRASSLMRALPMGWEKASFNSLSLRRSLS